MEVPKHFPNAGVILHKLQTAYQSDHDRHRKRDGGREERKEACGEIGREKEPNNQESNE